MYEKIQPDIACITQRLMRVLWSSLAITQSTIKILERITILNIAPEHEDVADMTDRLSETFNAYSFLTRCNGWHDLDEDEQEDLRDQRRPSHPAGQSPDFPSGGRVS